VHENRELVEKTGVDGAVFICLRREATRGPSNGSWATARIARALAACRQQNARFLRDPERPPGATASPRRPHGPSRSRRQAAAENRSASLSQTANRFHLGQNLVHHPSHVSSRAGRPTRRAIHQTRRSDCIGPNTSISLSVPRVTASSEPSTSSVPFA
jgi:hypothetical protein